jgi:1-aminocyclopropane-1-carboxylate deaminase
MIGRTRKSFFPVSGKVLFAHLGDAPALNGYGHIFRDG